MNDALVYLLAVLAGGAGSLLYFGGLWWTVRKMADSARPHLLLLSSFLVRAALMLALFFAVGRAGLAALALAILTFILTRFLLTRRWGLSIEEPRSDRGSHTDAR